MVMAIGYDEAKSNKPSPKAEKFQNKNHSGGVAQTRFFGFRDNPDLPYAQLNCEDPGRVTGTHFHIVDQFQVVVSGKGTLGRHHLAPYGVHFTRAYTPYGPLKSDPSTGFEFLVMRAHPDPGSQHLPMALDKLMQVPDRQPWQISRQLSFPAPLLGATSADVLLQTDPYIKDEQGLAAYTLVMKPNARTYAPDTSAGDGQYLVVVKGSLLLDNKEHKSLALAFVRPDEGPFQICAGDEGLEAIVLNFPRPLTRAASEAALTQSTFGSKIWKCDLCSFSYDEAAGLPDEGIEPGTRWHDVPETWSCPDCGAPKSHFQMREVTK
jgi:rubredoxin